MGVHAGLRRFAFAGVVAGLVASIGAYELWAALSFRDEKRSLPGVSNFGRVNARLYRGAQPTSEGYRSLAAAGVQVVVRLSLGDEGAATEAAEVSALGMQPVDLPWSAMAEPTREQVAAFMALLADDPHCVVFVHCKHGADRTGTMIAMARIAFDGWTPECALREMRAFHYHDIFHWQLRGLVQAFPARLRADPGLVAPGRPYSDRSASIGSSFAALAAGR